MSQKTWYCSTLETLIPSIKDKIDKSPKKLILMSPDYLSNIFGPKYSKNPTSLYLGAKWCLSMHGIYIEPNNKDGTFILMRKKHPEDKLKYI